MTTTVPSARRSDPTGGGAPRTLAEDLRARSAAGLAELLRSRQDLTTPVAADLTQLASRATTRASVARALERLDRFTLQVVDAAVVLPDGFTFEQLKSLVGDVPQLPGAVARLRTLALLWGPDNTLRVVRTVRDLLGAAPAGLGPTLATALNGTPPARLQEYLADLGLPPTGDPLSAVTAIARLFDTSSGLASILVQGPPQALEVLEKLAWGPTVGTVRGADRPVRAADASTPVEWLLARGLLIPVGPDAVVLPREAALQLRGGVVHADLEPEPPAVKVRTVDPQAVDNAAAGQAFTAVRRMEELLELWSTGGPPMLRAGGIGVRETRRTAAQLDLPEAEASLWTELAYAAGLAAGDGEEDEVWLPTPAYDLWRAQSIPERWAVLAGVWLETTRVPGLAGTKDEKGKVRNALGPELDRTAAPELRRAVLDLLSAAGGAVSAADVLAQLDWRQPLRAAKLRQSFVPQLLTEAELMGVTGRGVVASYSSALLEGNLTVAAEGLRPLLPEPLDHVLLQADLTAVAPGPLVTSLAQELHLVADVESTGGATVYRFSEASVRRALDFGRSATDLHRMLAVSSRTPVPQPLTYLIDDVSRRHGRVRVGAASSYLRCDDQSLLSELVADRRSADLRLRLLAPTVVVAQSEPSVVLEKLRSMGYAPAAESATGDVVVTRPDARRTPPRSLPPKVTGEPPALTPALLDAAVAGIRAGDLAGSVADEDGELPRTTAAETLLALQAALAGRQTVRIGHVSPEGRATRHLVLPVGLQGGYVTVQDRTLGGTHTYPLHRITGVAEVVAD